MPLIGWTFITAWTVRVERCRWKPSSESLSGLLEWCSWLFSLDVLSDHGEETKKGNSDDDICSVQKIEDWYCLYQISSLLRSFIDLSFYLWSFLEDDATGWRGFNGGDSRWSTFSGRYSTRDIPYKRSLRDGRYLVPVINPTKENFFYKANH